MKNNIASVPEFPITAFPTIFQAIIKCLNEQSKFNIDHVSTMILTTASALVGNSVRVKIKNSWSEPCILWTAIVADSGSMKSPIINFCTEPLLRLEIELAEKHVEKIEKWEEDKDAFYQSKSNKGQVFSIPRPRRPDMILSTATIEGVVDAFLRNQRGFILLQDEIAAWIKDMTAYTSGSAQEQWLSLQNGKFIKKNTKIDDATFITKPFCSVSGGIQPAKLYIMAKDGRSEDGSLFRILFSFPDNDPAHELDDSDIDNDTIELYNNLMLRLYSLGNKSFYKPPLFQKETPIDPYAPAPPIQLTDLVPDKNGTYSITLSNDAKVLFYEWNKAITKTINDEKENSTLRSILKKMEGYIPRIALIIEAMYWADSDKEVVFKEIRKEAMQGAIDIVEYFKATAFKVQTVLNKSTKDNNGSSASKYKIDFNKLFNYIKADGTVGLHKELKQGEIIEHLMTMYGMSRKTAQRKIEDELTSTKYGYYAR